SPAKAAGIEVGDVIVKFDGKEVKDSASLPPIVGRTRVGVFVPVDVIRGRKQQVIKVKLGELPEDATVASADKPAVDKTNRLGLGVSDLTDEQRAELEVDAGVVVTRLVDGAASRAGVRTGDIILSIGNKSVKNVEKFQKLVEDLPGDKSVAVLVQRNGGPTFLAIRVPAADEG
ncbi:MAG: PDZ domain-containing protein, partial [Gammaproteobacteria bacterium]|nr:PDZ domain-containing protein [Gammaproteobacteria bacterium]